jgi:hypothetical protein
MELERIQFPLAMFWGVAFLAVCLWFLWKNQSQIKPAFVLRHVIFNLFLYAGCLWLVYQDKITTMIFGKVIHKGSPEEFPAGLVILGGMVFCFFIATMALGKNRKAEFKLYLQTFKLNKRF